MWETVLVLEDDDPDIILEDFLVALGFITSFLNLGLDVFVILEGSVIGMISSRRAMWIGVSFRGDEFDSSAAV